MKVFPVCIVTALILHASQAQWDPKGLATASSTGIADTAFRLGGGNPAAASFAGRSEVHLVMIPGLFGLPELRRIAIGARLPGSGWGLDTRVLSYGSELFRRHDVSISGSMLVTKSSSAGLSIELNRWSFTGYSPLTSWSAAIGYLYVESSMRFGVTWKSAPHGAAAGGSEAAAGMSVLPSRSVELHAEVTQVSNHPIGVRGSLIVSPHPAVRLLAGWSEDPNTVGAGIGLITDGAEVYYGALWHPILGWTHGFGVALVF